MRYDASIRHDLVSRPPRTPEERQALNALERKTQIHFEYGTEDHPLFRFKTPNTLHFSNGVTRRLTPIDHDIYHPHSEQWRREELYGIFGDPKGLHMRVKGHFTQYPYDHPYAQGPVFVVRNMFPRNKKLMPLLHEEVKRLGGNAVVVGGDTFGLGVPWTKPQIRNATSTPETVAEQIQRMGAVTRRNALESQEKSMKHSPFPFAIWPLQKAPTESGLSPEERRRLEARFPSAPSAQPVPPEVSGVFTGNETSEQIARIIEGWEGIHNAPWGSRNSREYRMAVPNPQSSKMRSLGIRTRFGVRPVVEIKPPDEQEEQAGSLPDDEEDAVKKWILHTKLDDSFLRRIKDKHLALPGSLNNDDMFLRLGLLHKFVVDQIADEYVKWHDRGRGPIPDLSKYENPVTRQSDGTPWDWRKTAQEAYEFHMRARNYDQYHDKIHRLNKKDGLTSLNGIGEINPHDIWSHIDKLVNAKIPAEQDFLPETTKRAINLNQLRKDGLYPHQYPNLVRSLMRLGNHHVRMTALEEIDNAKKLRLKPTTLQQPGASKEENLSIQQPRVPLYEPKEIKETMQLSLTDVFYGKRLRKSPNFASVRVTQSKKIPQIAQSETSPFPFAIWPNNILRKSSEGPTRETIEMVRGYLGLMSRQGSLAGADLRGLDLRGQDLQGKDFQGANLSGCNLSGVRLDGANLEGAICLGTNFSGAMLSNANLATALLHYANLSGVDASNANLQGSNMSRANLRSADITGADISHASLTESDLHGIQWDKSDLLTSGTIKKHMERPLPPPVPQERLDAYLHALQQGLDDFDSNDRYSKGDFHSKLEQFIGMTGNNVSARGVYQQLPIKTDYRKWSHLRSAARLALAFEEAREQAKEHLPHESKDLDVKHDIIEDAIEKEAARKDIVRQNVINRNAQFSEGLNEFDDMYHDEPWYGKTPSWNELLEKLDQRHELAKPEDTRHFDINTAMIRPPKYHTVDTATLVDFVRHYNELMKRITDSYEGVKANYYKEHGLNPEEFTVFDRAKHWRQIDELHPWHDHENAIVQQYHNELLQRGEKSPFDHPFIAAKKIISSPVMQARYDWGVRRAGGHPKGLRDLIYNDTDIPDISENKIDPPRLHPGVLPPPPLGVSSENTTKSFSQRSKNMFDEYFSVRKGIPTLQQWKQWRKEPLSHEEAIENEQTRRLIRQSRTRNQLHDRNQRHRELMDDAYRDAHTFSTGSDIHDFADAFPYETVHTPFSTTRRPYYEEEPPEQRFAPSPPETPAQRARRMLEGNP
jgi:uncharacterized protein YjbI with pentapeptide repeats